MMKIEQLSYLCLRIISIFLFILGINQAANLLQFTLPTYKQMVGLQENINELILVAGVPAILMVLLGIVFWLKAKSWSSLFVLKQHQDDSDKTQQVVSEADKTNMFIWQSFILSVIGLILVIFAGISITQQVMLIVNSVADEFYHYGRLEWFTLIQQLVLMTVGLLLMFKAKGVLLVLQKIRGIGLSETKKEQT